MMPIIQSRAIPGEAGALALPADLIADGPDLGAWPITLFGDAAWLGRLGNALRSVGFRKVRVFRRTDMPLDLMLFGGASATVRDRLNDVLCMQGVRAAQRMEWDTTDLAIWVFVASSSPPR